jgi:hypothetical protein
MTSKCLLQEKMTRIDKVKGLISTKREIEVR